MEPYVYLSILVGLGQIGEGLITYQRRGHISQFALHFSAFEWVWAGISIWMLVAHWADPAAPLWLPMLFLVYVFSITCWGMATHHLEGLESPEDLKDFVLSPQVVYLSILFGLTFTIASLLALRVSA